MALKVVVGPVFSEAGGVSRHIDAIARHSSHSVSKSPSPLTRAAIGSRSKGPMYEAYTRLRMPLGLWGYDILHSHAHPWFTRFCRRSRPRASGWVHTYHAFYFPEDYPSRRLEPWQVDANEAAVKVARDADFRVSVSNWLKGYLQSEHGIESVYIPNGVDLAECVRADGDRFRRARGLSDFVLFVGSDSPMKNHRAFVDLASDIPSVRFVMVGHGLDAASVARGGAVPSNLTCVGPLDHASTLDAIAASSAVVSTSVRESQGLALLEGMALGRPVVAPDHSGCAEVVGRGRYGLAYAFGSREDLAEKLQAALASPDIGARGRERVLEEYDWSKVIIKVDQAYSGLSR